MFGIYINIYICVPSAHWNKLPNVFSSVFVHWKAEEKKQGKRKGRDGGRLASMLSGSMRKIGDKVH